MFPVIGFILSFYAVTFLHKKPAEQRIKEFVLQLSLNKNTAFGSSLSQFLSTTRREVPNLSYQQLLSNIRSYIDSAREKLQKEYNKELVEHGMKVSYCLRYVNIEKFNKSLTWTSKRHTQTLSNSNLIKCF